MVDVNAAGAEETAHGIGANGGTALAFTADVTQEDQVARAVAGAVAEWGTIDLLHNHAGLLPRPRTWLDCGLRRNKHAASRFGRNPAP